DGSGGVVSTICLAADLVREVETWRARGEPSGIDMTVQRKDASPSGDLIKVNRCVPIACSGSRIVTGVSNRYLEPWRTKSLFDLRLTRMEIGTVFRAEPGAWAATCCGCGSSADVIIEGTLGTSIMALSEMAAAVSGGAYAGFGSDCGSRGL